MNEWAFVIFGIVGLVALVKVISLIVQKKQTTESSAMRSQNQTITRTQLAQNETGTMIYYANDPHRLGDKEYRFNYKRVYDSQFGRYSWRAYIVRMPSLRGRDSSLHITHRLSDGNGTYWVCWDSAVETLKDMQVISRFWADSIQEYVATGKRFG